MDRTSMVPQTFQNFPETRLRPRGTLTTPGMHHSTYSMWMVSFSAVGPNSPRNFAHFCKNPGCFRGAVRGMLKFLNRTIGRARRGANPRVRQFLEQERSFGKAAPARAGSHYLK